MCTRKETDLTKEREEEIDRLRMNKNSNTVFLVEGDLRKNIGGSTPIHGDNSRQNYRTRIFLILCYVLYKSNGQTRTKDLTLFKGIPFFDSE